MCKGIKINKGQVISCGCSVVGVKDHSPIDACRIKDAIVTLSCGRWEFVWNLSKENK